MRLPVALLLAAVAACPALAQEDEAPRWTSQIDKAEAWLSYGTPGSEETTLSLSCARKSGQIRILFPVEHRMAASLRGSTWVDDVGRPAPWPVSVNAASGPQQTTIRGDANADEMAGGSTISLELSERAPVVQAFARTGELRLVAMGETVAAPPAGREAGRFVRACR
ncbi:MAG: hypothetical protein ABW042_05620 [Phenylobacterium sp.]